LGPCSAIELRRRIAPFSSAVWGTTMGPGNTSDLLGSWTYRSIINDANISTGFDNLEFGRGELRVEEWSLAGFGGRLIFGDTYQFALEGSASFGDPPGLGLRGRGDTTDSANQNYDYVGYLVPSWRDGVDQPKVLVGSVLRAVAHGSASAGVVASFYAVKR
jgi:hypothetical protein